MNRKVLVCWWQNRFNIIDIINDWWLIIANSSSNTIVNCCILLMRKNPIFCPNHSFGQLRIVSQKSQSAHFKYLGLDMRWRPTTRYPINKHLRASSLLDSTFWGDTQGNFSSEFCPRCNHFFRHRDSCDGLLRKSKQTLHTVVFDFQICRKEERLIIRRGGVEGPLAISFATPCTQWRHTEEKSLIKLQGSKAVRTEWHGHGET